jgi:hypothetical protein
MNYIEFQYHLLAALKDHLGEMVLEHRYDTDVYTISIIV